MGIYKWGTPLSDLKLWSTTIQNVYKWTDLVWQSAPPIVDLYFQVYPSNYTQYFTPTFWSTTIHWTYSLRLLSGNTILITDEYTQQSFQFARGPSSAVDIDYVDVGFVDATTGHSYTLTLTNAPTYINTNTYSKISAYAILAQISIANNTSTGDNVKWDEQNWLLYFNFSHLWVYDTSTWGYVYYSWTICIEDTNYNIPSLHQLGQQAWQTFTPWIMSPFLNDILWANWDKYYYFPWVANTPFVSCGNSQWDANVILDWYNNPWIYDKWNDETVATRWLNSTDMKILAAMFYIPNQWQFADWTTFSQWAMGIFSNFNCSFLRSIDYNNWQANCQWEWHLFGWFIPSDFNYLQHPEILVFEQDLARATTQSVQFDSYNMPNSWRFYWWKIRLKDLAHTSYSQDS